MTDNYIFQTYLPLVADLVNFFVWFSMPNKMLAFRKDRRWLLIFVIAINMVLAFICRSIPSLLTSPIKTLVLIVTLFLYMFFSYEERNGVKFIAYVLWLITMTLADMLAVITMSLLQISPTETIGGLPVHFVSGLLSAVFSYIMMFGTSIIYNKIRHKRIASKMWQFEVVLMSQFLFMLTIGYCSYKNDHTIESMVLRTPAYAGLLFVTVVVAVLADVFLYRILQTNSQNYELKQDLEITKIKSNLELEYYEKLKKSVDESKKLNHDFSNAVAVIEGLINSPDTQMNKDVSSNLISDIKETLNKTKIRHYCENELVNLIVLNKAEELTNEGIDFSANMNIPNDISVKDFDLCRIFTNVLDNAKEASIRSEHKDKTFVILTCTIKDKYLNMVCENYYDTPVVKKNGMFVSSKNNHKSLGIQIIKEIALSYNGELVVDYTNDVFVVKVSLKVK